MPSGVEKFGRALKIKEVVLEVTCADSDWHLKCFSEMLYEGISLKKQAGSLCVASKWAQSGGQRGLFSRCPVTFRSRSTAPSSCADTVAYTLPLLLCNPDSACQVQTQTNYRVSKLLSRLRQTFPLISAPFPEEVSVCLSSNAGVAAALHLRGHWTGSHEGHSCEIITSEDWAQVYTAAKQPLHHHWGRWEGGTWASPTLARAIGCLGNEMSTGCWCVHGGPAPRQGGRFLCVFWWRRIRAVSD